MPRSLLLCLALALSLPWLAGCSQNGDTSERALSVVPPPSEAAGPATRWAAIAGERRASADGPEFQAAFARCRWMAEQGLLEPVDAATPGPRSLTPIESGPPSQMRPIRQERVGENGPSDWWPTEARLAPCMRVAGFVRLTVPPREF